MRVHVLSGLLAIAGFMFTANAASAQSIGGCGCGSAIPTSTIVGNAGPTTSYQRFSYEPTTVASSVMSSPVVSMPISGVTTMQSQPVYVSPQYVASAQSYRRYSYQPSMTSRSSQTRHKEGWEYSKADPRKDHR